MKYSVALRAVLVTYGKYAPCGGTRAPCLSCVLLCFTVLLEQVKEKNTFRSRSIAPCEVQGEKPCRGVEQGSTKVNSIKQALLAPFTAKRFNAFGVITQNAVLLLVG